MTKSILVFTLALASATPAFAQAITQSQTQPTTLYHREWEGSFFAGYTFHQDYTFRTVVRGRDDSPGVVTMRFTPGYRIGGRVTQNFAEYFSATMEYALTQQELRLTNVIKRVPSLNMGHFVHSLMYNIAFSPMPRDSRFRPHIELGTGALLFHISDHSKQDAEDQDHDFDFIIDRDPALDLRLEDSWAIAFNYGVGFKYLVADKYALTVNANGRVSGLPTYGLPRTPRVINGEFTPAISTNGKPMQSWQLTIGFAHQWDAW